MFCLGRKFICLMDVLAEIDNTCAEELVPSVISLTEWSILVSISTIFSSPTKIGLISSPISKCMCCQPETTSCPRVVAFSRSKHASKNDDIQPNDCEIYKWSVGITAFFVFLEHFCLLFQNWLFKSRFPSWPPQNINKIMFSANNQGSSFHWFFQHSCLKPKSFLVVDINGLKNRQCEC